MGETVSTAAQDKVNERRTEEQVIAELKSALEFAKDFFKARGKVILSQNCACQLAYFTSAELFQHMEDNETPVSKDVA
jgi:hypothetical protein